MLIIKNIATTLIPENYFIKILINSDGDCFLHAVNKFISNIQKFHLYLYIRNLVYNYITKNEETLKYNELFIHNNKEIILFDEYISSILDPGNYSGELELYAVSQIFNISINIYKFKNL